MFYGIKVAFYYNQSKQGCAVNVWWEGGQVSSEHETVLSFVLHLFFSNYDSAMVSRSHSYSNTLGQNNRKKQIVELHQNGD